MDGFALSEAPDWTPRYNLGPTQSVPVIRQRPTGERVAHLLHWGLIPSWAKDREIATKLINARGETLAEKPSFRSAYAARRCVIPANGFYEWRLDGQGKQPYFIQPKDKPFFAFAGLWERWQQADGSPLDSFTIVTTAANESMAEIHERMPVMLDDQGMAIWLARQSAPESVAELVRSAPDDWLTLYPVGKEVGDVRNDCESLMLPLKPTAPQQAAQLDLLGGMPRNNS